MRGLGGRLEVCEFAALSAASELASSETRREQNQQYIGSTSHQSSRKAWPRVCNSFKHFILVFSTQVSYFNPSLNLSFNLIDFMLFSETLHYRTPDSTQATQSPRKAAFFPIGALFRVNSITAAREIFGGVPNLLKHRVPASSSYRTIPKSSVECRGPYRTKPKT